MRTAIFLGLLLIAVSIEDKVLSKEAIYILSIFTGALFAMDIVEFIKKLNS